MLLGLEIVQTKRINHQGVSAPCYFALSGLAAQARANLRPPAVSRGCGRLGSRTLCLFWPAPACGPAARPAERLCLAERGVTGLTFSVCSCELMYLAYSEKRERCRVGRKAASFAQDGAAEPLSAPGRDAHSDGRGGRSALRGSIRQWWRAEGWVSCRRCGACLDSRGRAAVPGGEFGGAGQ